MQIPPIWVCKRRCYNKFLCTSCVSIDELADPSYCGKCAAPPGACSKCILPISSPFRSLFEQSRRRPGRSGQFNMSQRPIKRRRTKLKKKPKWNKAFFPVWTPQDWEHLVNCLKNPPSFQGIVLEVPSGSNPTDPRPLQHMLDPQQLIKNLLDLIHTKVME